MIITITIITIILLFIFRKNPKYKKKIEDSKANLSKHFNRYLKNISPKVYSSKLKTTTNNSNTFKNQYLSKLRQIPENKRKFLINYTKTANTYLTSAGLKNLIKIPTNYVMSIDKLEMRMPYTLDNIIVLPQNFLNRINNKIDKTILETLIHEKLHIIQRLYQDKFNNFYKRFYSFLDNVIRLENLPRVIKDKSMTNPDNNFDLWLYKLNGKTYIPSLEITKNGLKEFAYEYKNYNNKILLKNILKYSNTSQTHPNELFAYEVSEQIIANKLNGKVKQFLNLI
tara:strand:+ start:828 stop:1676 length:849 start_codon:yes stop_codon:yes gene_type:complete